VWATSSISTDRGLCGGLNIQPVPQVALNDMRSASGSEQGASKVDLVALIGSKRPPPSLNGTALKVNMVASVYTDMGEKPQRGCT
jgi:F0F1-type ATP synthase gamma subunit